MDIQDQFGKPIEWWVEEQEQALARKYIQPDDVVLELGARYGSVSCTINAKLRRKTNQVVVEPDERVWEALERNKRVNDCHFHIVKGFIARQKLSLTNLDNHLGGYGSTFVVDPESTTPSFNLEQIQNTHGLTFSVLVADCEGGLELFLDENPNIYDTLRMLIFEADYPEKCDYRKITSTLLDRGFYTTQEGHQNVWLKSYMPLRWLLPLRAKDFRLLSATYGTHEQFADVTESLVSNIGTQHGRVQVSNELCGIDPHHGKGKTLTIDCVVDGKRRTIEALEGAYLYTTDDASTIISFMLRCHNAEATLQRALTTLECLLRYGVRYEIVAVLHRCTDTSRRITEQYASVAPVPVRIFTYEREISRAGLETYVTDEDHENSIVTYYNWCLDKTRAPFVFKWDSDFEMSVEVAKEIASTLEGDWGHPLTVKIPTRFKDGQPAANEPWMSSALLQYVKSTFWEVPSYLPSHSMITLKNEFLHNDSPRDPPKLYWDAEPWFSKERVGDGNKFRRRFNLIKTLHSVPRDMGRCCAPNFSKELQDRLIALKIADLDALWECDLEHV